MAAMNEELILASASPARARLLAAAGLDFRVEAAAVDEEAVRCAYRAGGAAAAECALALAVGADQILVCDGLWFDKPAGMAGARAQLQALRGKLHELATAVCAVAAGERVWHAVSRPLLTMRAFSDAFLDAYLAAEGSAILGSVGAYRIEGRGIQLFADIDGDYFAVLVLPLLPLLAFLRERGALRQ